MPHLYSKLRQFWFDDPSASRCICFLKAIPYGRVCILVLGFCVQEPRLLASPNNRGWGVRAWLHLRFVLVWETVLKSQTSLRCPKTNFNVQQLVVDSKHGSGASPSLCGVFTNRLGTSRKCLPRVPRYLGQAGTSQKSGERLIAQLLAKDFHPMTTKTTIDVENLVR